MFSSKRFVVSLLFRSMILSEFSYSVTCRLCFILSHVDIQLSPIFVVAEKIVLSSLNCLGTLVKNQVIIIFISDLISSLP